LISGGVGSLADVQSACGRGLAGLIVGRALYTGAVELARALEIAACS
jgi:phosphoribosylformimino-5-aminoimidazole carboxamide ribotide isomerase